MTTGAFAIWLYGSHARGNNDESSDVDLFVAADPEISSDKIERFISVSLARMSVSRYGWGEIRAMAKYGSLFLYHLRLEGHPLYEASQCSGTLGDILATLGDYQHTERDLVGFLTVLRDIRDSLEENGVDIFELAVLGTIIRHCSILGCWLIGKPSFGRVEPVKQIVDALGLPSAIATEFPELYRYRMYWEGRYARLGLRDAHDPRKWLELAEGLVSRVGGLARV